MYQQLERGTEPLAGNSSQQYIAFRGVSKVDLLLDKIDKERATIGKDIRLYHQFSSLMIVKLMPSPFHEIAHSIFGDELKGAIAANGPCSKSPSSRAVLRHVIIKGRGYLV
jgi:hypothetical protein